jgi:hypothetical protein
MISKEISKPSERKSIVLLDGYNYNKIKLSNNKEWLGDKEILVLNLEDISKKCSNDKLYKKLENEGLLSVGNVLFQNPYEWDNYSLTDSVDNLIKSSSLYKHMLLSNICMILGAKSFSIKDVYVSSSTSSNSVNVSGSKMGIGGEANFKNKISKAIKKEITLKDSFEGNNKPNIEEAKEYLAKKHLTNDLTLLSLIESRSFSNKLKKRKITINLTSELGKTLQIGAKIKIPTWSIGVDFERVCNNKQDIKMDIEIDF